MDEVLFGTSSCFGCFCRLAPTDDALPGIGIGRIFGPFPTVWVFTDQSPVDVGNKRANDWGLGV